MPKGFDTMIGETGRGLSGGQKQRLLIARALYRNPRFLFLDEATNALDSINEQKIVEALKGASIGRTVVIIAHRLSTVRHADQLIVMDRGRIAEVGTHDELLTKNGLYASLIASQMNIHT
jgi:ATP-binding cassette subfamily B protein